jgi:transposase-like protein
MAQTASPQRTGGTANQAKHCGQTRGRWKLRLPAAVKGEFEPQIMLEHQRERRGFDDKILPVYGPGLPAKRYRKT